MNDSSIHTDYKNLNNTKETLNSLLGFVSNNPDQVSTNRWLNYTQNAINASKAGKSYHGTRPDNFDIKILTNVSSVLRGYKSTLNTDRQDSAKLNAYILYRERKPLANTMRMSSISGVRTMNYNDPDIPVQTWNRHSQNVGKLIQRLKFQIDDQNHVNSFDNKYGHMKPSSIKYVTAGGQSFYFPEKMLNLSSEGGVHPTLVPELIDNRNNYAARERRQLRLANNYWRQLHALEVNHHWFNYHDDDQYMGYANKALGDYQFETVHDKVWYQYYLERIRNEKNSMKDLRNLNHNDKIQKAINHLQYLINHAPYESRRWNELAAKRNKLRKQLSPFTKYDIYKHQAINHDQREATKWLNQINHRNAKFKDRMHKEIAYWNYHGTVENIRNDPRYACFGYIRPRDPQSDNSYIYFQVNDESPAYETQVNSTPSEYGVNATTGTTEQQTQVTISGNLFNPNFSSIHNADGKHGYFHNNSGDRTNPFDAGEPGNDKNIWRQYYTVRNDSDTLANWCKQGTEMFYSGQNWYSHCIISEFQPDLNNSGDDGSETSISFSMTLVITSYFDSNVTRHNHSSHRHGRIERNNGKKSSRNKHARLSIPVKQGYTYGGIAARYHVSVTQLRKLNHWPDTRIPIYVHGKRNRIIIR